MKWYNITYLWLIVIAGVLIMLSDSYAFEPAGKVQVDSEIGLSKVRNECQTAFRNRIEGGIWEASQRGEFSARLFLDSYSPCLTKEYLTKLLAELKANGYTVKVKIDWLEVDWSK